MSEAAPRKAAPAAATRAPRSGRPRLGRVLLLTAAALVLAGIVHIVAVLTIPAASQRDAVSVYAGLGASGRAELVTPPPAGLPAPRENDPATVAAVCALDLSGGAVRVRARVGAQPLGLSLHRSGGGVAYAITDRAAVRGMLEFVVLTQDQFDEKLAEDDDEGLPTARELRIVSPTVEALIVARAMVPTASQREEAVALVTGVSCGADGG